MGFGAMLLQSVLGNTLFFPPVKNVVKLLRNMKEWQCYTTDTEMWKKEWEKFYFPSVWLLIHLSKCCPKITLCWSVCHWDPLPPPSHTRPGCVRPVLWGSCPVWWCWGTTVMTCLPRDLHPTAPLARWSPWEALAGDTILTLHSGTFSLFLLEANVSLIVQIAAEVLMKHIAAVKSEEICYYKLHFHFLISSSTQGVKQVMFVYVSSGRRFTVKIPRGRAV